MATLYEIDRQIEEAILLMFDTVDEETGEVAEGTAEALASLQAERSMKLDNIGAYIKNLTAEMDALTAESKRLKERADRKKKQIERLKDYVSQSLQASNESKFESSRVVFSFRKSESVSIPDIEKVPLKWLTKKVEYSPNKTEIKKALKEGIRVKGCEIEVKQNLQIK